MAAALVRVGFKIWMDYNAKFDLEEANLQPFRGVNFPGGFSYADVLGSVKRWVVSILFNEKILEQFKKFYLRKDTFSLSICTGCQLMALIGWVDKPVSAERKRDILLEQNTSEIFKCRWSTVKIEKSKSVMVNDMKGSVLGVWIAHGEGRFTFKDNSVYNNLIEDKCISLRYVNDDGIPTDCNPDPNGSTGSLVDVYFKDGRHLTVMSESCVQPSQCPYIPPERSIYQKSP